MGSKFQKKSNNSPFIGKEGKTIKMAVGIIKEHITITPCGTFTPDDIIVSTLGMALNRKSATEFCKTPEQMIPSSTTYRTCAGTIEFEELLINSATRSSKSDCYPGLKPAMPSNPFWVSLPARACLAINGCEAAGTKW